MLLKSRTESDELLLMRSLNRRMELTDKDKFHYMNLEKGYAGEVKFDLLAECLLEERYIIHDLLLEVNHSIVQIDTLIISQYLLYLVDIKNYHGDFYLNSDKLYAAATNREYTNPVDQIKRSTTLLRQLLQNLKENYLIDASVIFINSEFTLFQAPLENSFILPTQLNRFFNEINKTPSKLNEGHKKLAQKLLSLHLTKNPHTKIPEYHYDKLQKGFLCKSCGSLLISYKNYGIECGKCGQFEKTEQAILRHVKEFQLLFPERKITTQMIFEWCNADSHKRTVSRVLKKYYTPYGITNDMFYQ
ncbi:nuclease-related domain-containing protein [Bacillus tuaregi]|uniref:nuclease-related domain-containing protein n=1 Tax=Bacillus tuaregi TaxID=1816695 RepID=UPI0008F86FC9|nr:nuclease-related domain-containing protein [Bacillus tuaregi]